MAFNLNHPNNRVSYRNGKRFLFTLLILNSFLGCIYLIHEQKVKQLDTTQSNDIYKQQDTNEDSIRPNKAIKYLRNVLENEYNQDDLIRFYNHVQNEYSLGLKCTRTKNISVPMHTSNTDIQIKTKLRITSTTDSSSIISSTKSSSSSHFQRTDLYKFLIDHADACLNESVDLLVIIISKSDNYKTRDAIRRTWGARKNLGIYSSIKVKLFFLIDLDENLSQNIRLENNIFHDIIQVELPQHYTLVTHRVLSLLEWSFRYCRTAKYVFKTDDDIFINFILLLKFISPLIKQQTNNSFLISDMNIYGYKHIDPPVFRYTESTVLTRYVITYDEFPCDRYPTFLSGFGYVLSKKARDAILYTAYQDPEPFRISDVYLTGIIPNYLSISTHSISNYDIQYDGECTTFFNHSTAFACASGFHHGVSNDIFGKYNIMWQSIKQNLSLFIN